jgi:hypothetical protein
MMAILAVLVLLATQHTCAAIEWGVVIDCGSSHTEVQIYSWGPGQPMAMFTPPKDANLLENGTMAMADPAFVANPSLLGAYFQPLITQAARWVPADKHAATRVRAFATAGMRLYSASTQESMWAPVRAQLAGPATPFAFVSTDATTISGNYEVGSSLGSRFNAVPAVSVLMVYVCTSTSGAFRVPRRQLHPQRRARRAHHPLRRPRPGRCVHPDHLRFDRLHHGRRLQRARRRRTARQGVLALLHAGGRGPGASPQRTPSSA